MHIKQQWQTTTGVIIGLLSLLLSMLLIRGLIVSRHRLEQSGPSLVVDEKITFLCKEEDGEEAYSLLKKIVFLCEGLQPLSLLKDIALVDAQEEKRENILSLPLLLEKHGFIMYTESKEYVSLNAKYAAEIRNHYANLIDALPAIIAALGTKNHLMTHDRGEESTSNIVLENELKLLGHMENNNQLATPEGLKLLIYLIYTSICFRQLDEALHHVEKAKKIAHELYPEDHQDKINMLIGVGFAMVKDNRPGAAYDYYQEALHMLQRLYPNLSPFNIVVNEQRATILSHIGRTLNELSNTKEAKKKIKQATKIKGMAKRMQPFSVHSEFWAYFWYNWSIFKIKGMTLGTGFLVYFVRYFIASCRFLLKHCDNPNYENLSVLPLTIKTIRYQFANVYKEILSLFNATEIVRRSYSCGWMWISFLPYYLFDKIFTWHLEPSSQAPLHFAWVKIYVFFGVFFTLFLLYNFYPWQYHYRENYWKKRTIAKSMLVTCVKICCALLVSACLTVIFCTLLLELAILKSKQANKWASLNRRITMPAILKPNQVTGNNCCVCYRVDRERWNPCWQCAKGENRNNVLCFSCFAKMSCTPAFNVTCPLCRANIWRDSSDSSCTSWSTSYTYKAKAQATLAPLPPRQHLSLLLDSFFVEESSQQQIAGVINEAIIVQEPQQAIQQRQARHQVGVTNPTRLQAMQFFFVGFMPMVALLSWLPVGVLEDLVDILASRS